MKKLVWFNVFVILVFIASSVCTSVEAKTTTFPRNFIDDSGKKITIRSYPKHIVSLYPSITETVFALGRGKAMIGRSDSCNYPSKALTLPIFASYKSINDEQILKAKTDLLLVHISQYVGNKSLMLKFIKNGVQVVVIGDASTFEDAYADIQLIGKAIGATRKANALIANMKTRLFTLSTKAKAIQTPRKVYIEVDNYEGYWTTGQNTFMDEMLTKIHATNVAHNLTEWSTISSEQVIAYQPDAIIVTYANYDSHAIQNLKNRPGWSTIPAVQNNKVFSVNGDLVTRPGPRLILGVEALAKKIYPNQFK